VTYTAAGAAVTRPSPGPLASSASRSPPRPRFDPTDVEGPAAQISGKRPLRSLFLEIQILWRCGQFLQIGTRMEGRGDLFGMRRDIGTDDIQTHIVDPDRPSAYQLHSIRERHVVQRNTVPSRSTGSPPRIRTSFELGYPLGHWPASMI
jgi:hypothetical protein